MSIAVQLCSLFFMLVATTASIGNGWIYRENARRQKSGGAYVSFIPLLTQAAVLIALALSSFTPARWLPAWSFWMVALSDVSLWVLALWGARWMLIRIGRI